MTNLAMLPARLRPLARLALLTLIVSLLVGSLQLLTARAAQISVGLGSYNTTMPAGAKGPTNSNGVAAVPKKTANVTGAIPTNSWWSSLVWAYFGSSYSSKLHANPLSFQAVSGGLNVAYPTSVTVSNNNPPNHFIREYHYPMSSADLTVGVSGLSSPDAKLDGYSDWTVTGYWAGGGSSLRATFGRGVPYVYLTKTGGDALVSFNGTVVVWSGLGTNVVGATINGRSYGLFAPTGATWSRSGNTLQSSLNGLDYFSIALLPADSTDMLERFHAHAYAFITDTQVSWQYEPATSTVRTTYAVTTTPKEGGQSGTISALYRHQWLNTEDELLDPLTYSYVSPRGEMRLREGASFETRMRFNGVLPSLPNMGSYDKARLYGYVNAFYVEDQYWNPQMPDSGARRTDTDAYWIGKAMGRLVQQLHIADQLSVDPALSAEQRATMAAARDDFLAALKSKLEGWLQAPDGKTQEMFYYNSTWGTLLAAPASFGSDTELNDHHFHYGYFIQAAAAIAQYDPDWARPEAWGGMIALLAKDANNWDPAETRFPRLRNFDPYLGINYASGHGGFDAGNNQESSSEGINYATGLILLGSAIGDSAMRDAGIFMYTTEAEAIDQYWFDVDDEVFPDGYTVDRDRDGTADEKIQAIGINWGDGGAHGTWFSAAPEMIHGINFLPIVGGSLHMGEPASYIRKNYDFMQKSIALQAGTYPSVPVDNEHYWRHVLYEFLALAEPAEAARKFETLGATIPEEGESYAHTYHWIHNLNGMGLVDYAVSADSPTAVVFSKNGLRTYVAYNATASPVTVSFSTGVSCVVAPRTLFAGTAAECVQGATPTPSSTRTPGPTGTPTRTPTSTPTLGPGAVTGSTFYLIDGATPGEPGTYGQLSTSMGAGASSDTTVAANGSRIDTPYNPLVYTVSGVAGYYDVTKKTAFSLWLDAGTSAGNGTQARVSYDFDGNGTWDRTETWGYFATNPVADWESYARGGAGGIAPSSATGSFRNIYNGTVKIEIWNAIGSGATSVRTSATSAQGQISQLSIPFTPWDVPPTSTSTATPSPTDGPSPTPSATSTETSTPPPSNTATRTGTPTATATVGAGVFAGTVYVLDGAALNVPGLLSVGEGGGASSDTIPATGGGEWHTDPHNELVYTISNVSGVYDATKFTQFTLYLDSATTPGHAIKARVSYDFTGDGTYDRVERYSYFPTDPVNGWETYTRSGNAAEAVTGTFANLSGGTVRLEVWTVFGSSTSLLRTSATQANGQQSRLSIPFTAPPMPTNTSSPTATDVAPTDTRTATAEPTDTRTATAVELTDTPTASLAPTDTRTPTVEVVPTYTSSPTATATEEPPTHTRTVAPTDTRTATATEEGPTATATAAPTNTRTAEPTDTRTATATEAAPTATVTPTVAPTDTRTPTVEVVPTYTSSPTATATEEPPTHTPTRTPVPVRLRIYVPIVRLGL